MVGCTGFQDFIGLANLAGFAAVEEEIITPAPRRFHKGLPEVPVGKRHAVILVKQADINGKCLKHVIEPVAFGIQRLCRLFQFSCTFLYTQFQFVAGLQQRLLCLFLFGYVMHNRYRSYNVPLFIPDRGSTYLAVFQLPTSRRPDDLFLVFDNLSREGP